MFLNKDSASSSSIACNSAFKSDCFIEARSAKYPSIENPFTFSVFTYSFHTSSFSTFIEIIQVPIGISSPYFADLSILESSTIQDSTTVKPLMLISCSRVALFCLPFIKNNSLALRTVSREK